MTDVPATLRAELARLKKELESDPRIRQMREIEHLLAYYEKPASTPVPRVTPQPALNASPKVGARNGATKWGSIRGAITVLLRERGTVPRSEIFDHLVARGLLGEEKKPLKRLGSYLYKGRTLWITDGQGNWSLRPREG
jgi:hypothetical protein